jgi:ABC-type polysaccharide/polyol phosphate export permease
LTTSAIDHITTRIQGRSPSGLRLAIDDLVGGVMQAHIWLALAWQDIVQRYRRSFLGPLWITISTGVMVGVMGPLYGRLFAQDMSVYFPYLAVSIVLWQTIAQVIGESSNAFIAAEGYMKQVKLPYSLYVFRLVWRNLIMLMHNLTVVLAVVVFFKPPLGLGFLLFPVGLLLFVVNSIWIGILLGMACARFRDMPLIVTNIMQIAFFITPIIWPAKMLGDHEWWLNLNPLFHLLEIMRAPLVGGHASLFSWVFVCVMAVTGYAVTLAAYSRYRARIAYWV